MAYYEDYDRYDKRTARCYRRRCIEAAGGDTEQALGTLREKGAIQAAKRSERVAREGVVEVYAHPGSRVGVMLELNCETDFVARNERFVAFAHDLALHVAAMQPAYVNREEVPQDEVDSRSKEYREDVIVQGKPEEIANKIVEGRLNKFYEENCLLEQGFVRDDDVKVQQLLTDLIGVLGENIVVRRFIRYELGEEAT